MSLRSRFAAIQSLFHRCCWAMLLAGLCWSAEGVLPSIASGDPIVASLTVASPIVANSKEVVLAVNLSQATVQVPPSVATRLRQALSKRTKIPAAKLKLVEATAKTWTDGCLGLAKADEICTEALVAGWRVVFSDGKQRWIYRSDQQAQLYRLEP